jgi:hypothetical protein
MEVLVAASVSEVLYNIFTHRVDTNNRYIATRLGYCCHTSPLKYKCISHVEDILQHMSKKIVTIVSHTIDHEAFWQLAPDAVAGKAR